MLHDRDVAVLRPWRRHQSPERTHSMRRFCADQGRLLLASRPADGLRRGSGGTSNTSVSRKNGDARTQCGPFLAGFLLEGLHRQSAWHVSEDLSRDSMRGFGGFRVRCVETLESLARIEAWRESSASRLSCASCTVLRDSCRSLHSDGDRRWAATSGCVSGTRRRIGALTDGFSSGGIQRTGLGAQSSSWPITSRLRRRTRWWGSMTSCGWHGWPARSSRANLSRPARLPLVADQVSSAVTLAAMARQVFSLLPGHHPSVGAHRRPERVGSAFSHHLVQSPNGTEAPSVGSSPPGPRTDFASPLY